MDALIPQLSRLLNGTLNADHTLVSSSAAELDRLSQLPNFPFALIAIATGGDAQGLRIAAATYLKNFTRRYMEGKQTEAHTEFRNQFAQALLQSEPAVLKVLVEAFRMIIVNDFVKENAWPDFVPELKLVIQSSNLISQSAYSQWRTINALTVLQTIIKPFQYFLNPKIRKEPVPLQLELIAEDILVPLQATFHQLVDKALSNQDGLEMDIEQSLLIICKCMYFAVRSYMPSALCPILPSFCGDLFRILDSLSLPGASDKNEYLLRLKTAKRSLIIFCALVTRHRKHADKLMPTIIDSAIRIAKISPNISMLDTLPERIISLAFDVISHVLETGPGWRLVSPHFSSLLDSAILPALSLNKKDMLDWEEDVEEYMRKNLPSELDDISGWAEDLFTARKSAINLLGVIAIAKGPPVAPAVSKRKKGDKSKRKERRSSVGELLVIPLLSKFRMPSDADEPSSKILQDYYGVLMAYGGLQDFLNERNPEYTSTLLRLRVLPVYSSCSRSPYLLATANWVLGELASCLSQAIGPDIYTSLMKALVMPDVGEVSCYPVRASAAGAIAKLLENDYVPPDWFSLLETLVNRLGHGDENECSLLFQLLNIVVEVGQEKVVIHIPATVSSITSIILKNMPPIPEPWPQVVERGFAALASIAPIWESSMQEDIQFQRTTNSMSNHVCIASTFSSLLQQAWLMPLETMEESAASTLPPTSCIDDASCLLGFVMRSISTMNEVMELKLNELLAVWANIIADWNSWQEMEDLAVFNSIQEIVNLHRRCDHTDFFTRKVPSQNLSISSSCSIIEGISSFVCGGISAYPSATRRACSCVHALLNGLRFSVETETIRQSMAVTFTVAAFSCFRDTPDTTGLWKPLLLAISSCYISYPDAIEQVLEKKEDKGFMVWAYSLANVLTNPSDPGQLSESEIKLAVITFLKVVEHLVTSSYGSEIQHKCFVSLIESFIRLKEVEEEENGASDEETDDENDNDDDEEDSDFDEDSEDDEREETEEEFLNRYAKAAADLEESMVEEGDSEDEAHDVDLGVLDEVDIQALMLTLMSRYQQTLIQGQEFPSDLIEAITNIFPQWSLWAQSS